MLKDKKYDLSESIYEKLIKDSTFSDKSINGFAYYCKKQKSNVKAVELFEVIIALEVEIFLKNQGSIY